ncbi:MAG: DUF151 domain-containing protein [Bacteroidales bacterium]|nr:DUF151 domain-containing protein [Bacteroidales bacterium]MDP2235800.1 DUF151 domain-containing protein [Bacteroidales bacterium]
MDKILLEITGMSYSHSQSGAYALILGEVNGARRLPIIIGGFEAQSIALGLEKMQPARPMTHDLMKNFADFYGIELTEVIIHKFKEGVFHALLICDKEGMISEIDARTSDAVALAIRFKCPVYTYEKILSEAGIIMENDSEEDNIDEGASEEEENEMSAYLTSELEEMLKTAVENEEYERASLIRDEIQKRKRK